MTAEIPRLKFRVYLNGTDTNPWHRYGLTQNPFPQVTDDRYLRLCLRMQSLGGDPIPDTNYIREKLDGWPDKFIEICCTMFKPGKIVTFEVEM